MIRIATLVIGMVLWGHAANAEFYSPIQDAEFGLICPQPSLGERAAPDTLSGFVRSIPKNTQIAIHSAIVPAELNAEFGIRVRLAPGFGDIAATVVITHPPYTESGITRESYSTTLSDSGWSLSAFRFDEPFEILPGAWTFALQSNGRVLLRQRFDVVQDYDLGETLRCPNPDLSS